MHKSYSFLSHFILHFTNFLNTKLPNFFHFQNVQILTHKLVISKYPWSNNFLTILVSSIYFSIIKENIARSIFISFPWLDIAAVTSHGVFTWNYGSLGPSRISPILLLKVWQIIVYTEDQKVIFIHNIQQTEGE